jgi:hypothetical protein
MSKRLAYLLTKGVPCAWRFNCVAVIYLNKSKSLYVSMGSTNQLLQPMRLKIMFTRSDYEGRAQNSKVLSQARAKPRTLHYRRCEKRKIYLFKQRASERARERETNTALILARSRDYLCDWPVSVCMFGGRWKNMYCERARRKNFVRVIFQ